MRKASQLYNKEQQSAINNAVSSVEAKCAVEIVPAVATASGRYDRAEDLAGVCLSLILFIAVWLLFQRNDHTAGGWDGLRIAVQLPWLVGTLAVGFIAGTLIATRVAWLRRLFTSRKQMRDEVAVNARQVFFNQRVHHTKHGEGILIYVSLYEKLALILVDQAASEHIDQNLLDEICTKLLPELRKGEHDAAICNAIVDIGVRLAPVLQLESSDKNELSNRLILID